MKKEGKETGHWKRSHIQLFWSEIASFDHVVQVYGNWRTFLNTLEGFSGDALIKRESVIIIGTDDHNEQLIARLNNQGFDTESFISSGQLILLEASKCLSSFMLGTTPNEMKFREVLTPNIQKALGNSTQVRIFGEMVDILLQQGNEPATILLEEYWHRLQLDFRICVFCAYSENTFYKITPHGEISDRIYSKVIDGKSRPSTEIYYKSLL